MQKKSNVKQTMNIFEPQETVVAEEKLEDRSSEALKIVDPCPRCGGRSALSKRPAESGGSHYCLGGCLSEDRTDCFYFTPKAETFDEQAVREEMKKIVASDVKEIETEVIGEGEQQPLIEVGEKWEECWRGMPEFVQEDLAPWKSIYVHFETREDMERFAKLVKQKIGLNTRSIWYPEAEIGRMATKRYVDSGTVDKRTKDDLLR